MQDGTEDVVLAVAWREADAPRPGTVDHWLDDLDAAIQRMVDEQGERRAA